MCQIIADAEIYFLEVGHGGRFILSVIFYRIRAFRSVLQMYQRSVRGPGGTHRRAESEYLEEAEASGVEAVLPLAVLQREELQQLHDELGVGEIFKDDLFTLSDTEKRRHASEPDGEGGGLWKGAGPEHAPRSSRRTASHLLCCGKLRGSSFL